jgi:ElaB/YqjD/DUF883 family membrane-anchored ribosome-binding protein
MDNTSSSTPSTPLGVKPFPASDPAARPTSGDADEGPSDAASEAAAAPIVDGLLKRVTQSAHDAVDSVAAKMSSVADSLQGGAGKAGETRDEWLDAARTLIREHPIAAVAGAVVIGAALLNLRSSRDR